MDWIKGFNCPSNKYRTFYALTAAEKDLLLSRITLVMDCECFAVDSDVFREVCVCDLNSLEVLTFSVYDNNWKPFEELSFKDKCVVQRQSKIHGTYYRTGKTNDASICYSDILIQG